MKMITAIIRPEKLQAVKDSLKESGINALTMTEVRGRGQQSGIVFTNRVGSLVIDEIEKTRIDVVLEDEEVDTAITAIKKAAATGHMGDGRIFVLPVERSIRIRDEQERRRRTNGLFIDRGHGHFEMSLRLSPLVSLPKRATTIATAAKAKARTTNTRTNPWSEP